MDAGIVILGLRAAIGGIFVVIGLAIMLGGAIGLLRFPDFYTRLHANAAESVAAVLIVLGLAISANDGAVAVRLVLLAALIVALAPMLSHLAANAAHAAGLAPIVGRHTTPRPSATRDETQHD